MTIPAAENPATGSSTANLSFRPAGVFDLDLLAALHQQCFQSGWDRPWSAQSFGEILAMPGAAGLIASQNDTDGEAPVGFGLTLRAVDEVELLLLAILPGQRRHGFAGKLLTALLQKAQGDGARRALLEVAAVNEPAIACYQRAGFTQCGRRKAYYSGKIDALIFEKPLG
jgi:ribosomal-protein-alanine N-acetyltransferase